MSRKAIHIVLPCLLCLLPALLYAQSLTRLEYWFDDDFASRQSVSLSGSDVTVVRSLNTDGLDNGVHKVCFRALRSDGMCSAVSTSQFFKQYSDGGETFEYWLDDDYEGRMHMNLANTEEEQELIFDLSDEQLCPIGYHRLNFRVAQAGKGMSATYTTGFWKRPLGTATQLEYWFDDDTENSKILDGKLASTGDAYIFNTDIDVSALPVGVHRLNYRPCDSKTQLVGMVQSATILKVPAGTATQLEYWFDDDTENSKILDGKLASSGDAYIFNTDIDVSTLPVGVHRLNYRPCDSKTQLVGAVQSSTLFKVPTGSASILEYWLDDNLSTRKQFVGSTTDGGYKFVQDLDLGNVSPGAHRLSVRSRSADGKRVTAVNTVPIIVKSKYNIDPATAKVTQYCITVDDEQPMVLDVLTPKDIITIPYTLDARYLSEGGHTIKANFWNSANAGVSTEGLFNVVEMESPTVNLTAQEKDGLVLLQYNAVPNDVRHHVMRVSENGTRVKVYENPYGCFTPMYGNSYTDDPPAGSYIYYVQTRYEDYAGVQHTIKSNEVTVNVNKSQDEIGNYGYIVGWIQQNVVSGKWADIIFSDGVYEPCYEGKFRREKIPVGTVLTINVDGGSNSSLALQYEPVTVTIKPGENFVYIKGQSAEDMAPNNYAHDLVFDSDLEWIGNKFSFLVKNWTKKTWTGHVRMRAISEKNAQEEGSDEEHGTGDDGSASVLPGSVASMPTPLLENNYYYTISDKLTIAPGGSAVVTLNLENVFPDTKKDYYLIYIESAGKWDSDTEKSPEIKPVAINYDYNVTKNPMTRLIDKSLLNKAEDLVLMENIEYAANLVLMVCGHIKAFDGILGNIEEFSAQMLEKSKKMGNMSFTLDKYNAYLEHAMETETFNELLQDEMVQLIPQAVIGQTGSAITKKLRENIKSDILSNAWDKVTLKDVIKGSKYIDEYLGKAMKVLKYIKDYKNWDSLSTYDKHFYCIEAILKYTESWNPFSEILKTYVDVGEAMIRKALEYGEEYYGYYQGQYLYDNIPSAAESSKFDYNKFVDFKIEVQTNRLVYFNFLSCGTSQIKEVKVMLSNRDDINRVDTIYFNPIGVWDGVMLKQTRYSGIDPMTGGGNIEFGKPLNRMWMEIYWRNGRKSKIPLLTDHSSEGVDFTISTHKPYRYTIKFKSGTTRYENIADIIELKK